jgi:hypothetical protein
MADRIFFQYWQEYMFFVQILLKYTVLKNKTVRVQTACGVVVDKAALGQIFSEYFRFPCQSFHQISNIIITYGWHNRPISGRSAEWTQMTPPLTIPIKKLISMHT